jgi:excisionase family DNA binding protein
LDATQERDGDKLLPPGEVARLFGVDPRTIGEWARAGKIGFRLTLGGKRRYWESEVRALIADQEAVA